MPIRPNFLERLLFFDLGLGPAPVLDIFAAIAFRAVLAAVRLGIFDALHGGPLTARELADRITADERGTAVLLNALESLGYVARKDGRYTNTAMAARWMVRNSPSNVAAGFDYWGTILAELWDNLEESIRTGRPPTNLYAWVEQRPDTSQDFQAWMIAIARLAGDEIVRKVKLPPAARRLLDVGGGHAMYSIALCRHHPRLSATVFDSPQALRSAQASVAAEKMADRVALQEGDFLADDLGTGYDVVLVFNIVHGFSPEQNTELLRKVARALNPGGMVVIAEQLAGRSGGAAARAAAQLLGLSYFHLLGGRLYSFKELAGWLTAAGFANPRRVNLLRAPGSSLVFATLAG